MVVFGKGGFCGICFSERWPMTIFYHRASVCTQAELGALLIVELTLCASATYQRLSCKGQSRRDGTVQTSFGGTRFEDRRGRQCNGNINKVDWTEQDGSVGVTCLGLSVSSISPLATGRYIRRRDSPTTVGPLEALPEDVSVEIKISLLDFVPHWKSTTNTHVPVGCDTKHGII